VCLAPTTIWRAFNVQAVAILYPYLRAAVSNLTGLGVRRAARSARGGRRALSRGQGTARSLSELIFHLGDTIRKMGEKSGGLLIV